MEKMINVTEFIEIKKSQWIKENKISTTTNFVQFISYVYQREISTMVILL